MNNCRSYILSGSISKFSDFYRVYVILCKVSVVSIFYHFEKKNYHQENNHLCNDAFFRKIISWLVC